MTDGNYAVLADSTLPSGHYTQVRLILGENNTVVVDRESHELEVPSSSQSGLKLIPQWSMPTPFRVPSLSRMLTAAQETDLGTVTLEAE